MLRVIRTVGDSYNDNNWPGKFEAANDQKIAEFLNQVCLDGMYEEQNGSVTEPPFHWSALIFLGERTRLIARHISHDLKAGYILHEDEDGFVTYDSFDSMEEAKEAWIENVQQ